VNADPWCPLCQARHAAYDWIATALRDLPGTAPLASLPPGRGRRAEVVRRIQLEDYGEAFSR